MNHYGPLVVFLAIQLLVLGCLAGGASSAKENDNSKAKEASPTKMDEQTLVSAKRLLECLVLITTFDYQEFKLKQCCEIIKFPKWCK